MKQLDRIERKLDLLLRMEAIMATSIAEVEAAVSDLATVEDSVVHLLDSVYAMLVEARGDPAAIKRVLEAIAARKVALADAVVRNTDAAPPEEPPVEPTPA